MSGASLRRARRLVSQNQQVVEFILRDDFFLVAVMFTKALVPGWAELMEQFQCRDINFMEPLKAKRSVVRWCFDTLKLLDERVVATIHQAAQQVGNLPCL